MRAIILLFVLTGADNDLEYTMTTTIRGFADIEACEAHLAILKRTLPANLTIKKSDCYEGFV